MSDFTGEKFLHVHIPKAGGTSLRAQYMKKCGAENTLQWVNDLDGFVRTSELRIDPVRADKLRAIAKQMRIFDFVKQHVKTLDNLKSIESIDFRDLGAANFKVATGHLSSSQIIEADTKLPITAVVRQPLERAWSHYRYWQSTPYDIFWHPRELDDRAGTSFEEFALHPSVCNFQSRWLGALPISVLGTLETLPNFLEEIGMPETQPLPHLNKGVPAVLPDLGRHFTQEFVNLHSEDHELYAVALQ